jgi:ribosomal protein S18 acetylase RimI-like enzyme
MLEGLRRLHTYGAHTATVITSAANLAALQLYQSVGFAEAAREYLYRAG